MWENAFPSHMENHNKCIIMWSVSLYNKLAIIPGDGFKKRIWFAFNKKTGRNQENV